MCEERGKKGGSTMGRKRQGQSGSIGEEKDPGKRKGGGNIRRESSQPMDRCLSRSFAHAHEKGKEGKRGGGRVEEKDKNKERERERGGREREREMSPVHREWTIVVRSPV